MLEKFLVVEDAAVPGENHRPWESNWYFLSLEAASRVHSFGKLQRRARTHAVLVIGLYEFLGNPTTYLIEPPRPSFYMTLTWFITYIYYPKLQFLNHVIIIKSN